MTAEAKQMKKKEAAGTNGDVGTNEASVLMTKSGKKRKPRPIQEAEPSSDVETSEGFMSSTEFGVSSSRKGRAIGKRLPSARPKAGNFVPNRNILDQPFPDSPGSLRGRQRDHSRSLSPKGKAKSLQTLTTQFEMGEKATAESRKGRGRVRSISPAREGSHASPSSEGEGSASLTAAHSKKKDDSRSQSSSPVRKAKKKVSTATGGGGALSAFLSNEESSRSRSLSPSRKTSHVSTASVGSAPAELWTLPRKKPSVRSVSLSPTRTRRPLEKVIEENESAGVSTILKNKKKAMERSQSSSPVRKPKSVSQAIKAGELSPLPAVLTKKTNEIRTNQSLSPIREAKTVSKAIKAGELSPLSNVMKRKTNEVRISRSLSPIREAKTVSKAIKIGELSPLSSVLKKKTKDIKTSQSLSPVRQARRVSQVLEGEQASQIASVLKKKNKDITGSRSTSPVRKNSKSTSSSPVRKGRANTRGDDERSTSSASNRAKRQQTRPKSNSRSLSPVRETTEPPQSPGTLSTMLTQKKNQFKRSLSFTVKSNTGGLAGNEAGGSRVLTTRSLSPKKAVDDSVVIKKRPFSLSPYRGSSARIDFTGAVIDVDDNRSVNSQLTMPTSMHNDFDEKAKHRMQSLHTIRSHEGSDDEDDGQPASTFSFTMDPPFSVLSFGDRPPDSAQFSILDTSELGSALDEHIQKSRSKDTENSTPSAEDDNSEMAKESLRNLNPDGFDVKKSFKPVAPGSNPEFKDGRSKDFPGDTKYQKVLRYMNILPPVHHETSRERRIRALTWASLICDFLAALVSVSTFDTVNMCCGDPILSTIARTDWELIIKIFVYVYISMIFMEVVPVIRHQLPFNLINPTLGFLVTFAVFFDDDIAEAVFMWVIEVIAIICEYFVYRLKKLKFREKEGLILDTEDEIKEIKAKMRDRRRKMKKLRQASPGNYRDRVAKHVDIENGSYPEPPITPGGPRSSGSIGVDTHSVGSRSPLPSRSPVRNSPIRNVTGSLMRQGSRSISIGSRSAASSLSPVRTFSNSPKRISSRSPVREKLENDSVGSLSPVRESFRPRTRNASLSPLRRGSSSSMLQEHNSEPLSPSRPVPHRIKRNPSVRRGSSGGFSAGNQSAGSSPGRSARTGPRVGRSPVRRHSPSASSDTMRVPMGSDDPSNSFSLTLEEEELEAHREEQRLDDKEEMQKMVMVRRWKQEQEADLQYLTYLLGGVIYNFVLVVVTLIFMSVIGKNQGLCIVDMTAPAIFESGQRERCSNSKCSGSEQCEFCVGDPEFGEGDVELCFYPWY